MKSFTEKLQVITKQFSKLEALVEATIDLEVGERRHGNVLLLRV